MKPTVGRIVYYKSFGTPNGEFKPEDRAAIITGVVDDETIHLAVMNPTGMFFNLNVKQGNDGGQWDWMPYQKQQAEKEEAKDMAKEMISSFQEVSGLPAGLFGGASISASPAVKNETIADLHSEYFNGKGEK